MGSLCINDNFQHRTTKSTIMSRAQKLNKVIKGLKKASKTHASQAKTLESISMKKGGKTKSKVNEAGNYTKPSMRKRLFNKIKAGG